jgi:short-subunit dehydrogenase
MELTDAHVLVTGASRGIGAAICRELHARGAKLTLVARDAQKLQELADELGGANVLPADLTDPDALGTLIARAEQVGGPVDGLVNNAGIDEAGLFWEMEPAGLRRLIDLNVLAAMELSRQVLPGMVERGKGQIVNLSSLASVGVYPGLAAYSATKAALSHFSAGLRADLKGLPIGVTNAQVGFVVPTDMADKIFLYEPAARAKKRFDRLGLLPDTDRDKFAAAVVAGMASGKRHVLRPRRALMLAKLSESTRRMTEQVLAGVPAREK